MKTPSPRRAVLFSLFLLTVLVLAGGVWRVGYLRELDQLAARGRADLALAGDRLVGQLQRYRDISVLLADHPVVMEALSGAAEADAAALLLQVADKSGARDIRVVDRSGLVVAGAQSERGENLAGRPHVRRALNGALGWGHGAGLPLTRRAYYHAAPIFAGTGEVLGAVVVTTDLNNIDYDWRGSTPATWFTGKDGEVFISNRSELLFWQRPPGAAGLIPANGAAAQFDTSRIGGHEIWQLGWGPYLPRRGLHLTRDLPVIGMTGEVLLDTAPARRLAVMQAAALAALCLAFGSLLFLAAERRRTLAQVNAVLEARVAARTAALREVNTQLRREAAEREEAQAALRRAQSDLVQAGKLSALGQMSSGISHELNQPLMAIRSFAENAVQFIERDRVDRATENLARISDMARRMGRIIQNLRAFSRQENMPRKRVELREILTSALELTQRHMEETGVTLRYEPPEAPLWVRAGEVRLGQVFVNLITNAVDAMADRPLRELHVEISEGDPLTVTFRDTGPGIEMPDKAFDPFYTTKPAGNTGGMGLGLSISYGIVQSFGGQIRGSNVEGGGAMFSVTLERADDEMEVA